MWITQRTKVKIAERNREEKPRERMETIFDGYEKLIKQQQVDIERKQTQLDRTQKLVDQLQTDLNSTRSIVDRLREELEEEKYLNLDLQKQLKIMKRDYKSAGTLPKD